MLSQKSILTQVETYTYPNENDGSPIEILLIGIESTAVGANNKFELPGFNRKHITNWLKEKYFHNGETIYAQIPLRTNDYPDVVREQFAFDNNFATDIYSSEDERTFYIYYPVNDTESIVLNWDVGTDHWSMKVVDQPSRDGNVIEGNGHTDGLSQIWSSR